MKNSYNFNTYENLTLMESFIKIFCRYKIYYNNDERETIFLLEAVCF